MKLKKSVFIAPFVIFVIFISAFIFINANYLFNPLLHKVDGISYLPFNMYTKPLKIHFQNMMSQKGVWDEDKNNEAEYIYKEFDNSKLIGFDRLFNSEEDTIDNLNVRIFRKRVSGSYHNGFGPMYYNTLVYQSGKSVDLSDYLQVIVQNKDNVVLQDLRWINDSNICLVSSYKSGDYCSQAYVYIENSLRSYFQKKYDLFK